MAAAVVGQSREGGATTSRSTTTSALRSSGGSGGSGSGSSGLGLAADACVDASRCPSWHEVIIWREGRSAAVVRRGRGGRAGSHSTEKTVARESLKGLGLQQMQLRSRHRQRMNRLEAPGRGAACEAGLALVCAGCGGTRCCTVKSSRPTSDGMQRGPNPVVDPCTPGKAPSRPLTAGRPDAAACQPPRAVDWLGAGGRRSVGGPELAACARLPVPVLSASLPACLAALWPRSLHRRGGPTRGPLTLTLSRRLRLLYCTRLLCAVCCVLCTLCLGYYLYLPSTLPLPITCLSAASGRPPRIVQYSGSHHVTDRPLLALHCTSPCILPTNNSHRHGRPRPRQEAPALPTCPPVPPCPLCLFDEQPSAAGSAAVAG
jgi:hypothetical protein